MISPSDLQKVTVFQSLTNEEIALFAGIVEDLSFDDGAVIFDEKAESTGLFFIYEGRVNIHKRFAGRTGFLTILDKGDLFGEVSFIDAQSRTASASAEGKVRVGRLSRQSFDEFAAKNPQAGTRFLFELMKELSRKFRAVNEGLDMKSCDQTIFDLITTGGQVKVSTTTVDYICKILYVDRASANPLFKIDIKGQQLLIPFHQIKSIALPNRYGQFV